MRVTTALAIETARSVAGRTGIAMLCGFGLAVAATLAHPDTSLDVVDTAAQWVHLPLLIGAVVATATALESHPAFGRDRRDGPWLHRLAVGPLDGAGVVALSAAFVAALLSAAVGIGFEFALGRDAARPLERRLELGIPGGGRLDPTHPRLELGLDGVTSIDSIELRPLGAFVGRTWVEPRIRVLLDEVDATGPIALLPGGNLVRVNPASDAVGRVTVVLDPEPPAVVQMPAGSAVARERTDWSVPWNAALAAATSGLSVAVALAMAILARRQLGMPVLTLAAVGLIVIGTGAGVAPVSPAVAAHGRGLLFWTTATRAAVTWTAALSILSIAAAAAWSRLVRR